MAGEGHTASSGSNLKPPVYVACVLDLLGQTEKLAGWAAYPKGSEEVDGFQRSMQDTVGTVVWFRKRFRDFFNELDMGRYSDKKVAALAPDELQVYQRFTACNLGIQQFSDTFVFYSQLANPYGDLSIVPVFRMLAACMMAMQISLGGRVPFRGAICVGTGLELTSGNFYGPALALAHCVESEISGYPRVVVHESVVHLLDQKRFFSCDRTIREMTHHLRSACLTLMCRDDDRQMIVDFLGRGAKEHMPAEEGIREAISKGYRFVCEEAERFQQADCKPLAKRYRRLRAYMRSRLRLWGISPKEAVRGE